MLSTLIPQDDVMSENDTEAKTLESLHYMAFAKTQNHKASC